jgi:hypothetical protein
MVGVGGAPLPCVASMSTVQVVRCSCNAVLDRGGAWPAVSLGSSSPLGCGERWRLGLRSGVGFVVKYVASVAVFLKTLVQRGGRVARKGSLIHMAQY